MIVAGSRTCRVQEVVDEALICVPQSRWSRSAADPAMPKRSCTSATAFSRSHSSLSVCPGRHGSSTGAGSSIVETGVIAEPSGALSATRSRAADTSGPSPTSRL